MGNNSNFSDKEHLKDPICSKFWHRGSSLKGTQVRPTRWFWSVLERQVGLLLWVETLMAALWESSFYHDDTGSGKRQFEILSLGSSTRACPTHRWAYSSCMSPGPCSQSFRDTTTSIGRPNSKPHWKPVLSAVRPTASAQGGPQSWPGWRPVSPTSSTAGAPGVSVPTTWGGCTQNTEWMRGECAAGPHRPPPP